MKIKAEIPFLKTKDFSVTQENFELFKDENFELLKTSPVPNEEQMGRYYQSENYISHSDSASSLFERIYHSVKKFTLRQKLNQIENAKQGRGSILDIGCGTGEFLVEAKNRNYFVIGIEPNRTAQALALDKGIVIKDTIQEVEDDSIDIITMWHVLEHIDNLEEMINELKRVLKPDGLLIIAVPNYKSHDAKVYKNYWAAYDVPRHIWHFSQNAITLLFKPFGFSVRKRYPMYFDSFYVSLLSEEYKTGKRNWLPALWNGFISNFKASSSGEYSSIIYYLEKCSTHRV